MALNLNKSISSMLPRMAAESFVIVASILLALSADAWLDARRQDDQRADHLLSLARDFEQMSVRANDSFHTAGKAVKSGKKLLDHLINSPIVESGPAQQWLDDLAYYEVFSLSVGAYEALVASGNIEPLNDSELVHELAVFFGSFSDMRASERLLLDAQLNFAESETYARLAGDHRLGTSGFPSAGERARRQVEEFGSLYERHCPHHVSSTGCPERL